MSAVHQLDPNARLQDLAPDQQQSALDKAREIMTGEIPLIPDPPDTSLVLFRGVFAEGRWHREARVKELTGADEEGISRMMMGTGSALFLNAMVAYGVAQIGPYSLPEMKLNDRQGLIDSLLVGEKELLYLNVLKATYGDQRTIGVACPAAGCGAITEVSFSITEDVKIRTLDDPSRNSYEFTTRGGAHIEYRLVTGGDQAEGQRRVGATLPEENTVILSRVISTVNGKPLLDPMKYARDLGALDRRNLLNELVAKQPGPYFEENKVPCATCGAESIFMPSWGDLL